MVATRRSETTPQQAKKSQKKGTPAKKVFIIAADEESSGGEDEPFDEVGALRKRQRALDEAAAAPVPKPLRRQPVKEESDSDSDQPEAVSSKVAKSMAKDQLGREKKQRAKVEQKKEAIVKEKTDAVEKRKQADLLSAEILKEMFKELQAEKNKKDAELAAEMEKGAATREKKRRRLLVPGAEVKKDNFTLVYDPASSATALIGALAHNAVVPSALSFQNAHFQGSRLNRVRHPHLARSFVRH